MNLLNNAYSDKNIQENEVRINNSLSTCERSYKFIVDKNKHYLYTSIFLFFIIL